MRSSLQIGVEACVFVLFDVVVLLLLMFCKLCGFVNYIDLNLEWKEGRRSLF